MRKTTDRNNKDKAAAYLFMLPAVLFLFLFKIVPILKSVLGSFGEAFNTKYSISAGLSNYSFLFKDTRFWASLLVTMIFTLLSNVLIISGALMLANFLKTNSKTTSFAKTMLFFPSVLSGTIVALLLGNMLDPNFGIVNIVMRKLFGFGFQFLSSAKEALFTLVLINVWHMVGYWMVFFLAGFSGIYQCLYEASEMDGASSFARFRYISLPSLRRTISFVMVSLSVFNITVFAQVYVLTAGGPLGSTDTLVYEMYRRMFYSLDKGGAYAISAVLLLITIFIASKEISKIDKNTVRKR